MGEVSDGLQAILAIIEAQQRSIDRLIAHLEAVQPIKASPPDPAPAAKERPKLINWLELTGEDRLRAWEGLASFVEALVARYILQLTVRPCWWQHTEAVEELTALWHAHYVHFADPNNLDGAMNWRHTFNSSRDRLRDMFLSCRDMHVDMQTPGVWMKEDMRRDFRKAVEADVLLHHRPRAGA